MNYQRLTMTFHDKRTSYTFQGMKQYGLEVLSEKECHHIHNTSLFLQLISNQSTNTNKNHSPVLAYILHKFQQVFESLSQLPPTRVHDHRILLQPHSGPVNVRPYRYPYYQKMEIEKMVQELLHSGLIRPN
ncbi:hypothetical protein ACOSQ2_005339 [Xanthoceras sorbifolium]